MRRTATALALVLGLVALASAAQKPVELRGAWTHPTSWKTRADADRMLARADRMNLNALFMLVYYYGGQVAYRTDMAPMLEGVAEGFDPLGYALAEGRKRGIEVHAWFVNGPGRTHKGRGPLERHPEWKAMGIGGRRIDWFDLCNPEVRAYQARLMIDCLKRYPVASLHFDYIRFGQKTVCVCPVCCKRCKADTGVDLQRLCYAHLPAMGNFSGNPLAQRTTAKVLMHFENDEPALAVNTLGKGRTIVFNWKADRWCPVAVTECTHRLLASCGVEPGAQVLVLNTETNGSRRWDRYTAGRDWIQGLGYKARRITDKDLSDLPAGAAVVMQGFYDMPPAAASHLATHVEAGGVAVFVDGPVHAVREHESARRLVGFARPGKYFSGQKVVRATKPVSPMVPSSDRTLDIEAEQTARATWHQWRKDQVTDLVRSVREQARTVRPEALVTAAVFRTADRSDRVSQDWPKWRRERLCDYVIPMSYVATPEELDAHFGWWKELDPHLVRIIPAVGAFNILPETTGDERAAAIAKQVAVCRRQGAHGVCLFVLKAIDDATAEALGRMAFPGKAAPYRPPAAP